MCHSFAMCFKCERRVWHILLGNLLAFFCSTVLDTDEHGGQGAQNIPPLSSLLRCHVVLTAKFPALPGAVKSHAWVPTLFLWQISLAY